MTDREKRLEAALLCIYEKSFTPVTEADLLIAAMVLKASGISMDALHATWARDILNKEK